MTDDWRLVNGKELFSLKDDPKQAKNVAAQHPEVLARLRGEYDKFWNDVSKEHNITSYMVIGSDHSPIVALSSHDWLIDKLPPWHQKHIIRGEVAEVSHWAIEVERDGDYEISLRRWPVEADKGINDGTYGKAFNYKQVQMRIGDIDETKDIPVPFFMTWLETVFNDGDAYEKLPKVIPYFVMPLAMFLLLYRYIQQWLAVWRGETDMLIVSHEAEDEVEEAAKAMREAEEK